jgi:hypothetical protein
MNTRRFDDVLKLVASVLFGTSVREADATIAGLEGLGVGTFLAYVTTTCFFLVYFRNIHGLICFDIWAANTAYRDPFERRTRHVLRDFVFGFFGVLVLPYLFLYCLKHHAFDGHPLAFLGALFAPIAIYWGWNATLLDGQLRNPLIPDKPAAPPTKNEDIERKSIGDLVIDAISDLVKRSRTAATTFAEPFLCGGLISFARQREPQQAKTPQRYQAYAEFLEYLKTWCVIDLISLATITLLLIAAFICGSLKYEWLPSMMHAPDISQLTCAGFVLVAALNTLADYTWNVSFYFPKPNDH